MFASRYDPGADQLDDGLERHECRPARSAALALSSDQALFRRCPIAYHQRDPCGRHHDGWFVLVAPWAFQTDVVQRMNREVGEFLTGEQIVARLAGFAATSGAAPANRPANSSAAEQEKWRALALELNIDPQ